MEPDENVLPSETPRELEQPKEPADAKAARRDKRQRTLGAITVLKAIKKRGVYWPGES